MLNRTYVAIALFALVSTTSKAANTDERSQRGQALHDTICRGCHEDNMYTERHLSRNPYFDLHMQTRLWSEFVKVKWTDAEIDDVVYFLRQTYYTDQPSK
jgi:mono/diheme cytochrome c family protein